MGEKKYSRGKGSRVSGWEQVPASGMGGKKGLAEKVFPELRLDRRYTGYVKCSYQRVLGTRSCKNKDPKGKRAGFADSFFFFFKV